MRWGGGRGLPVQRSGLRSEIAKACENQTGLNNFTRLQNKLPKNASFQTRLLAGESDAPPHPLATPGEISRQRAAAEPRLNADLD